MAERPSARRAGKQEGTMRRKVTREYTIRKGEPYNDDEVVEVVDADGEVLYQQRVQPPELRALQHALRRLIERHLRQGGTLHNIQW